MKRPIYKSLLPIMTVISVIICCPVHAEPYQMGESVTITITVEAYPLIDIEEFCSKPDAPPECKVNAEVLPEPEVTKEP